MKLKDYTTASGETVTVTSCYPVGFEKMPHKEQDLYDRDAFCNYPFRSAVDRLPDAEILEFHRDPLFPYMVQITCEIGEPG